MRHTVLPSIAFWVVLAMVLRVGVVPPESCGDTDTASLDAAARSAVDWIMRNQHEDGSYVYVYLIDTDTVPDEYNLVRHAGVTLALYEAAGYYKDRTILAAADAGMNWMIDRLETRHGWSTPALGDTEVDLGAPALMTVGLAERRLVTGDPQYDDLMRSLGRFIVALQHPDGGFDFGWNLSTDEPISGSSKYYPGESLWALALLHEAFPGEGWDTAAYKDLDYLVTKRDEVDNVPFPPLPDQWMAYGFAEMATWDLSDAQIEKAGELATRFGLLVRSEAQRQGSWYGNLTRGRKSRAAGLGTWVEGLGSLWRLAETDPRLADSAPALKDRLVCSAGLLAARQADTETANQSARPDMVEGAWFARGETRMDDQQHALSGLIYTLRALQNNPERTSPTPVLATP